MSNVEKFTGGVAFPLHKAMHGKIVDAIFEFDGKVSLTSVLGILELVKVDMIAAVDAGDDFDGGI